MMGPIVKLDRWFMERVFEPIAWWCERRFGFTAARLALPLIMVWLAAYLAMVISNPGVWRSIYAAIALVIAPARTWQLSRRVIRHGTANAEKHDVANIALRQMMLWFGGAAWLLGFIVIVAGGTPSITVMDIGNTACTLHFFFAACDAPPPAEQYAMDPRLVPEGTQ